MEAVLETEDTLISKLQSSTDLTGLHQLFVSHLRPFTPFFKPAAAAAVKKPVRSSKSKPPDEASSIRSLAKQFLTLIHKSLSFLPKRLSENPKIPKESALELFSIYRLCLDCLELIVPELAGRPYSVLVQRLRYVHCLELWESYEEAEAEGFAVLESFNAFLRGGLKGNSRKSKTGLIPQLSEGIVDKDVAPIIMEVVVTLVKCVSKRMSKVGDDYWRVISLVHESEPWFKILDAKDYEKFHRFLETNLHIITLFLVAEIKSFSLNLIREFSLITFKEYLKSSSNDQMYKVAHKICSSLFSQRDELSSEIILGVWVHVMDFVSSECEVGKEKTISEFLELVYYCASKFYGTTMSLCFPVAEHLYKLADTFYEDFQVMRYVLRLYGTGLLASSSHYQLKGENIAKSRSVLFAPGLQVLLDDKEKLNQVAVAINLLDSHIASGGKGKNSLTKSSLLYLSFWEALKFLSQSLAESIYLSRKEIFSVSETASMKDNLSIIYNVFHQFCHIFLQCLSPTEREKEISGENYRVISVVVVVAFMLSFKTNRNIKESTILVKQLISAEWIPIKRLKYLYVSLNNIAVILNRKKQLKEARKALKLCCNASWNYVVNLCKLHGEKSHESHDDLSENAIADFVVEASEKVVFLVELSRECNSKLNGIITESLKGWCVAENLIATLPIPSRLIKEWVKIQYLLSKDADTEHGTLLYSLIPSSKEISKRAHGKILEEELLAYDEKSYLNMSYSLRIRMKIIDILLEEIHVTKDGNLKKSRILIEKGKVLRAHGLAQLSECIQCLSDAIVTLKSIYSTKKSCSSEVHYLLICAYIQHALRIHEASPNMVASSPEWCNFLQDIDAALKLFLSPDHDHADEDYKDLLYLWHQIIDLLSIKGYLEIHPSLFDAVIKSCNKKNLPLAKTMSELWKSKRLSHALCASPVNDKFIRTFSNYQDQLFSSLEFWRMFTKELKPLVVGLHHTHDEIKQAASDLILLAPQISHSIFLSSSLYYELSERLISGGQIIEALTYAKEAHHLRSKLLQQKFEYSVEKMTETFDEDGKVIEKSYYSVKTFKISDMEATKDLGCHEDYSLTPWNVLSCYLESILQVGFVQEILGNVSEAEMLLRWGRNVSQFQALPLFEIAFSSMLGKLCRKLKLWSIAEKELSCAKNSLAVNCALISCKRCYSMLEISISQEIGDLFLSSSCSTGRLPLSKGLCDAKILYKSALDMLNHSEEARIEHVIYKQKSISGCTTKNVENDNHLPNDKSKTKIEPRRSRRTKKEMKPAPQIQEMACGHNRRITRSAHRSLGATHEIVLDDRPSCSSFSSTTENLCSTSDDGFDHTVTDSDSKCPPAYFGLAITTLCNKMKCWHCLHIEAVDFSNLSDFIYIKWELLYRRLCLRLLISIGKICGICDGAHEAHEILSLSISVLFNKNSPCSRHPMSSLVYLIESIGRDFPGDLLATERAAFIYYMSWFTLKSYPNQGSRNFCCELSRIGSTRVVMWLKMSFILCQEVPLLFQKTYLCRDWIL